MARVIVYHDYYGCDTGCCGHSVELLEDGQEEGDARRHFDFGHPYGAKTDEELKEYARELITQELGPEHVKDLDWDNCRVTRDC